MGQSLRPHAEDLFSNPAMGLYMKCASLANELVRSIPLTENRDHLKENSEDPEKSRANLGKEPERGWDDFDKPVGDKYSKNRDIEEANQGEQSVQAAVNIAQGK
ncbi:MAG: hypothetical protein JST01_23750 [Cyanobacteria bacterium SZAS TMP-1]|nr:hypothetical protein [Cyanobacteria bacterium SZAS TMP-1]